MISILHVDDNADDCELIRFRLSRVAQDLKFAEVRNAQDALALLAKSSFDCILCDFQMPGMDGLQLLKVIRANDIAIPFIFLTGQGNEALAAEALRAGADDYFRKDDGFAHYERMINSIRRQVDAYRQRQQKREAERRLFESEERYRLIFSSSPLGILHFDEQGIIIDCNESMATILATTRQRMIGFNMLTRLRDENMRAALHACMADGQSYYEGVYESVLSGKKVPVRVLFERILAPDQRLFGGVGLFEDLSQVRETERKTRESERLLRSAIEGSLDSLYILHSMRDASGAIFDFAFMDMNSRGEQRLAIQRVDAIGVSIRDLLGTGEAQEFIDLFTTAVESGETINDERELGGGRLARGWYYIQLVPLGDNVAFTVRDITARRQLQDELQDTGSQLQRVVKLSPVALYAVRADGSNRINFITDNITEMLGYSREELLSEEFVWVANLHPDDLRVFEEKHALIMQQGVASATYRYRSRQGEYRWIRDEMRLIRDELGNPLEFVGFISDISELKLVKDNLKREQANFRALFDAMHDAVIIIARETGKILEVNSAASTAYGFSREELLGQSYANLSPEREETERLLQGTVPTLLCQRRVRKDGSEFSVEISTNSIDFDGRQAIVWIERDIAARDEAMLDMEERQLLSRLQHIEADFLALQRSLRDTEQKYSTLINANPDAMIITDMQGNITYASTKAIRLFGYPDIESVLGMNILEQTHPDDIARAKERLQHRIGGDFSGNSVYRARRADGSWFHQEVNGSILCDHAGLPSGMMFGMRDVSERVANEQNFNTQRIQMEEQIHSLEAFSYTVSHDLNAPLRLIRGYIDILAADCAANLDDSGRQYLQRISDAAQRMSTLIRDLLWFSRSASMPLSREEVDLGTMVREVVSSVVRSDPQRLHKLHIQDGCRVDADPALLRVALENLIGNAWKFSTGQKMTVIEFGSELCEGTRRFYIKDNGTGFSPEQAEKIFEPFTRLHADSQYEGSGIGLTTVRRIMERHGGSISAEGTPGGGATFFFTLG